MSSRRFPKKTVLTLCIGALAQNISAQQAPAPQTQVLERVEITGSRIKRVDAETASPVQVITRDQIDRSGAKSVSELLTSVPASNVGSFNENAVASFTPGAGGVSLRGLGAQATLILINSRRVAPFGFASGGQTTFVDVNSIPIEVIERVEILLDGASAMAGVNDANNAFRGARARFCCHRRNREHRSERCDDRRAQQASHHAISAHRRTNAVDRRPV